MKKYPEEEILSETLCINFFPMVSNLKFIS